jgi:oligopeptide/dipeptide ABC transporter ATP-binding protein
MVQFDGQDLASLSPAALRAKRKEFQMIFQDSFASLNPGMTVGEVLSEPLKIHNVGTGDSRYRRIGELLESVSLSTSLIHRKPSELSGGQQQRLGIARGLALKPRLLIADEPVSALDPSVQAQILNLLGDLKRQYDLTLILISHSLHAVHYLCTHISVLYKGRLVEEAPAPVFFREPKHPYSRMLLESMPVLEPLKKTISSSTPREDISSAGTLSGCAFCSYCPHKLPVCAEQVPPLSEISPGEKVACFLYAHKQGF